MSEHVFQFFTGTLSTCVGVGLFTVAYCLYGRIAASIIPIVYTVFSVFIIYYSEHNEYYDLAFNMFSTATIIIAIFLFFLFSGVKKIEKEQSLADWLDFPCRVWFVLGLVSLVKLFDIFINNEATDYALMGYVLFMIVAFPIIKKIKESSKC